jgi:hypothetical protein
MSGRPLGIELLTAARAVELRKGLKPAKATQAVITELRKVVDPIGPDRFFISGVRESKLGNQRGQSGKGCKISCCLFNLTSFIPCCDLKN